MKTRLGFVSNSSSVSFTLIGVLRDTLEKKYGILSEDKKFHYLRVEPPLREQSLNNYDDETAIGIIMSGEIEHQEVGDLKDDETPKMFRERVRRSLSENFKKEISEEDIQSFYVNYYNG